MFRANLRESISESFKKHYLEAIINEIRNIRAFVAGYDFDDYADDLKTQYATERAVLNISEAVRNFEKHGQRDDPDFQLSSISTDIEWNKIKGIGMRHDYENVTSSRVWAAKIDTSLRLAIQANKGDAE